MMKIIVITTGTLPVPAAKGGAVETLIETFLRFNEEKNDFRISVFSVFDEEALRQSASFKNCNFIFINTNSFFYRISRGVRYVINRLVGNRIKNQFICEVVKYKHVFNVADIVIIENNPWYIQYLKNITSRPVVLHLHNDYINIEKKGNSFTLEKLDCIITVSNYIKSRSRQAINKNVKIYNVYNGIDLARFSGGISNSEKIELQNKLKFTAEDTVIIFTGRMQKHKGIIELINAFRQIDSALKAKLLIVGGTAFKDSDHNDLADIFGIKNLPDNTVFTGFINYLEIHKYYALGDFAVLPSLCEEAFGLTALEALASGLPVIITDSGGMPEVINNKCGIIVKRNKNLQDELKKEMVKLLLNKELRAKMSIEAKKQAQKFSDVAYYNNMVKIINSIIK